MTRMHLKKFKIFFGLRRSETHFRHPKGHQRPDALTSSINIIQITTITVYEVQSQKTDNANFENGQIGFQK